MIELLRQIRDTSSCRDRDAVAKQIVSVIYDSVQPNAVMLFRVAAAARGPKLIPFLRRNAGGMQVLGDDGDDDSGDVAAGAKEGIPLERFPLLWKGYQAGWAEELNGVRGKAVWAVRPTSSGLASALLVVESDRLMQAHEAEAIACFLTFFGNYLDLLDYSELDTLTGLNNRKTYDEAFDRILAEIPASSVSPAGGERRHDAAGSKNFWLGVIDIDHFKRVNDNFGHLFGDEVLLRVANLMKQSFRFSDKLFRFGGEEFVVMLRPTVLVNAKRAFERFREAVETHEFPQVGRVTCSIGFTRIDPLLPPSDTLGHADAALYFSKENGRNQVGCYELLIEQGALVTKSVEAAQPDFDIDALFD